MFPTTSWSWLQNQQELHARVDMMKREYGKCEACLFLHDLRHKINITEDSEEIKRVLSVLEDSKLSYLKQFRKLEKDIK